METQFTKKEFNQSQVSLLTRAMMIAGLFFLLIGAGGLGFSYVFKDPRGMMATFLPLFLVIMFTGMFISIMWTKVLFRGKAGATVGVIFAIYTITEALSFGYIFALLRAVGGMNLVPIAFAVTGGIFLLTFMIAKLMSANGVFTMGKMIGATSIAVAVLFFITLILSIVALASGSFGVMQANDAFFMLGMVGLSLITFLYICMDIWSISKMSDFVQYEVGVDKQANNAIVWFAAFRLLTDLLNILLIVCWYLIRFFGRRR